MNKKLFMHVVSLCMIFIIVFGLHNSASANDDWQIIQSQQNVPMNKTFTVTFSKVIHENAVRSHTVYVEDEQGNRVSGVETSYITGSKQLLVAPPLNHYDANTTYTLYVSENVYTPDGEYLSKPVKMTFTTSDELDTTNVFVAREDSANETSYTNRTVVLNDNVLQTLTSGTYEGNELSFTNPSAQVQQLQAGAIIILPATAEYPSGWAKKIVSVTQRGNVITFTTTDPELDEVFADIDISQEISLTQDDVVISPELSHAVLSENTLPNGDLRFLLRNEDGSEATITVSEANRPNTNNNDDDEDENQGDIIVDNSSAHQLVITFENYKIPRLDADVNGTFTLNYPKLYVDTKWLRLNRLEMTAGVVTNVEIGYGMEAEIGDVIDLLPIGFQVKAGGVAGVEIMPQFFYNLEGSVSTSVELEQETSLVFGLKKNEDNETVGFNESRFTLEPKFTAFSGNVTGRLGFGLDITAEVVQFELGGLNANLFYEKELSGEISTDLVCFYSTSKVGLGLSANIRDFVDITFFGNGSDEITRTLKDSSNCGIEQLLVDNLYVDAGESKYLKVDGVTAGSQIKPILEGASSTPDDNLTLTSQNPDVVKVFPNGKVTVAEGTLHGESVDIDLAYYNEGLDETFEETVTIYVSNQEQLQTPRAVKGRVVDSSTQEPLADVNVTIAPRTILDNINDLIGTDWGTPQEPIAELTTNNVGEYATQLKPGNYKLTFEKDGYLETVVYSTIQVSNDPTIAQIINEVKLTNLDFVNLGTVSGKIIDAVSGENMADTTLFFREGQDNKDGEVVHSELTNTDGTYTAELNAGTYTIELLKEGYLKAYFTIVVVAEQDKTNQNFTISKALDLSEMRVVLTWENEPSDLDLHAWGPGLNNESFHLYYTHVGNSNYSEFAGLSLDRDDTYYYGPETITLSEVRPGLYTFGIHNYTTYYSTTSTTLARSGARVDIYSGASETPVETFYVPHDGIGAYWEVFKFNGLTNEIIPVNELYPSHNDRNFLSLPEKK